MDSRNLLLASLLFLSVGYAEPSPEPSAIPSAKPTENPAISHSGFLNPADGDTVVFLGDSITHQCLYTQYIEDFFFTRYPERKIHFHTSGVGGDKAEDAMARFEDDVAALEPDFVTLLFGMNDGQYEAFNEETFAIYRSGMTQLIDRVEKIEAQAIALSPTMFDHHQRELRQSDSTYRFRGKDHDPYYNALLAYYGAWLRETAAKRSLPFINLWGPINDITFEARRSDPDFSIVEDAIHPGAAGHFIMAFSILSASQQERVNVSSITITKSGPKWVAAKNEKISDLKISRDGSQMSFTFLARSLPWVVPAEMSESPLKWGPSAPPSLGYDLTHAGHKLGAERLRIAGLPPGKYELQIDDQVIGIFTHLALGAKVELQNYPQTPQSRQSLAVALLNRERNDKAVRPMRDLWSKVKGLRKRLESTEDFNEGYSVLLSQIEELHHLSSDYEARIYEAATPLPRRYQLQLVPQR